MIFYEKISEITVCKDICVHYLILIHYLYIKSMFCIEEDVLKVISVLSGFQTIYDLLFHFCDSEKVFSFPSYLWQLIQIVKLTRGKLLSKAQNKQGKAFLKFFEFKWHTTKMKLLYNCGGLILAEQQMPTQPLSHSPSLTGWRRKNMMKGSWVKKRTGRSPSN